MKPTIPVLLVAAREMKLLWRGRITRGSMIVLIAAAWLPAFLLPLRAGMITLASFTEVMPLTMALCGILLPLISLLWGADLLSGEIADGTLVAIITLPISRTACFLGKCLGRFVLLIAFFLIAFGSAAVAIAAVQGMEGLVGYIALACAGLLLSLACAAIGTSLSSGRRKVRTFASALMAWVALVFAIDALLLVLIVALAPAAPQVGMHGHSELASAMHEQHNGDRNKNASPAAWLLTLNPVDLFRFGVLASAPQFNAELSMMLPGVEPDSLRFPLIAGAIFWIVAPLIFALRRFLYAPLN